MKHLWIILFLPLTLNAQSPAKKPEPKKEKTTWEKVKEVTKDAADATVDAGEKVYEVTKKAAQSTGEVLAQTRTFREQRQWLVVGNYSYFDMLVPGKYGVTFAYVKDATSTYELDYMRGSFGLGWMGLDIGEIQEQRLAVQWRNFGKRGTFNMQWGMNYNRFDVQLGSKYVSKITSTDLDYKVMKIETLGLTWGLGNRWQNKSGFVWAGDWIQLHLPLVLLNQDAPFIKATPDEDDKHKALKTLNIIRNFPRFAALKVQLGFTF